MARLEDLVSDIDDASLRASIEAEVRRLKDQTKFGLVYERHIPESVLLASSVGVKAGDGVRLRKEPEDRNVFTVVEVKGNRAMIASATRSVTVSLADLLVVTGFGEPIFPTLTPLRSIRRGGDKPSHLVVNAENFHALELLTFTHREQADCVYLDPPYNTGARDWKYNNDYVDDNDAWRHSKWLSFMEKRLALTKRLLKTDGVLIVTVDQNELHHLGMLLEDMFPGSQRQVVGICINSAGASGEGLSRVEEYAVFCFLGGSGPVPTPDDMLIGDFDSDGLLTIGEDPLTWESLLRRGNVWYRTERPNLCYPVLLNEDGTRIVRAGAPWVPPLDKDGNEDEARRPMKLDGHPLAWPVRKDGKLGIWRVEGERLEWLARRGMAYVSRRDNARDTWSLKYLMSGTVDAIEAGKIELTGRGSHGQVSGRDARQQGRVAKTIWYRGRHNAGGAGGTQLLTALLGKRNVFPFPKSVYAVRDCLQVAIGDRPQALIIDFFAGSGTTMHATALLNAEDDGHRRSILVTNNEVGDRQAKQLYQRSLYPGDAAFEECGVFEAATLPRCEAAVTGRQPDGGEVPGRYLGGRPLAQGFEENLEFFRLDYLDPNRVELGLEYEALRPLLWLLAGSQGELPTKFSGSDSYAVLDACGFAILFNEAKFSDMVSTIGERTDIQAVFVVTGSEDAFAEISGALPGRTTYMLPRDLLRYFRAVPGARA